MKNKRIHQSSGVTIIEILFSIGIIVTGLLGVAGLIMIAGSQMTQGLEADAMSNAGLNAIAEFETRNMQNPDNLLWYNTNTEDFESLFPSKNLIWLGANNILDTVGGPNDDIPSPSFCIDPYFIAQQSFDGNFTNISIRHFPSINSHKYKMPRVTTNGLYIEGKSKKQDSDGNLIDRRGIMNPLLSREIFIAKDDLAFSTPASGTELPEQQWIREGLDETTPRLKRANRAEYSWLAMLTPNRSRMHTIAATPQPPPGPPQLSTSFELTDNYLLSIVIFKSRVVTNSNDGELLFNITFNSGGLGGGEVALYPTDPGGLYPRQGDWVMLSALTAIGNLHRWYRITYIEEESHPGGGKHATLQGPDWSPLWDTTESPTQVTFIPGVIGVFEKTIRLGSARSY